jgi:hypothetical protein
MSDYSTYKSQVEKCMLKNELHIAKLEKALKEVEKEYTIGRR